MSHLTKLSLQVTNRALLNRVAQKFGWTIHQEKEFINPYSRDRVENPTVLRDSNNKVKLVLDATGTPNVDSWSGSMGPDYQKFLQTYTIESVKQTAMMMGKTVVEKGVDANGNLLLEVAY